MKNFALQAEADALVPWRYSYEYEGVKIEGDPVAAPIHGQYGRGRETMQHILASLRAWGNPSEMRAPRRIRYAADTPGGHRLKIPALNPNTSVLRIHLTR